MQTARREGDYDLAKVLAEAGHILSGRVQLARRH
jgi:hypothetical protein